MSLSQALALKKLEETGRYDFWNEARPKRNADIMAHYDSLDHLKTFLEDRHIHYSVMVDDVEKYDSIVFEIISFILKVLKSFALL